MNKLFKWMQNPKNFLVITGAVGSSKTHFCAALGEWILKNFNYHRYWLESKLHDRLQQGFDSNEGSPKRMEFLIDDSIVILDDVGSNGYTSWKEQRFFEFLDIRYNLTWPTIIISNMTRKDFYDCYEPRVTSRLFAVENTILDLSEVQDYRQVVK